MFSTPQENTVPLLGNFWYSQIVDTEEKYNKIQNKSINSVTCVMFHKNIK